MTKKKSPAQLDREIEEVVPGWARGLDMSESRRLAASLKVSQEELDRKQRVIESQRVARLPSIRVDPRTGTEAGSNVPRGVYVYVSSPGIAYGNVHAVADALRAHGERVTQVEPRYVRIAAGEDPIVEGNRVVDALRALGYRVEIGRER